MLALELILLQGAQSDLLSIYTALGERIYFRVDAVLGLLRTNPEMGPVQEDGKTRRFVVSRTPLGIFYHIAGRRIVISAILDLRQSPEAIKKRIGVD